jgi:hypothetical protein
MIQEHIPDTDRLYFRVHKDYYSGNDFSHNVFRIKRIKGKKNEYETGMSCDWAERSYPTRLLEVANEQNDNRIVVIPVGGVHKIVGISVVHDPQPDNFAHAEVRWNPADRDENERIRVELKKIAKWV